VKQIMGDMRKGFCVSRMLPTPVRAVAKEPGQPGDAAGTQGAVVMDPDR
jgi:hypothetical protein